MSDNNSSAITQKVWSMCGVLYDDGVSYGDYLETALESFKTLTANLDAT